MTGQNESQALPGYKKTLSNPFYPNLYAAPAAAPPDAGLPYTVGGYEYNPLIEDRPTPSPPTPDRGVRNVGKCNGCGAFGFSDTDAATCPECGSMYESVTPTYAPGTPWF